MLILLVVVMLIGSYIAGSIPLNVNLSEVIHCFSHISFYKNVTKSLILIYLP